MKIALVGSMKQPISENAAGGIETWTANFGKALRMRNHDVTFFASVGSQVDGRLITTPSRTSAQVLSQDASRAEFTFDSITQMVEVINKQQDFDIIHLSVAAFYYYMPLVKLIKKPVVLTFHTPMYLNRDLMAYLFDQCQNLQYVFISQSFARAWPSPHNGHLIYNGVDMNKFTYSEKSDNYFFWIGRISEEKGLEDAIQACILSKKKLFIAGSVAKPDYFNKTIKPLLDDSIVYLGSLDQEKKILYYQNARAVLMPIKWEEPFGLVAVEAMACGTPVITYQRGAMPEIIIDKESGYLAMPNDIDNFSELMRQVDEMETESYVHLRRAARQRVEKKFSLDRMTDQYIALYESL